MSGFEYLAALVSMVAALGIARGLSGFAQIIHAKDSIQVSYVQIVWTINCLLWLMTFWWFTFILTEVEAWTFPLLVFVTVYAAVIYLLIALLHPDPLPEGTDLPEYFLRFRKWFFGTFLALLIIDIIDTTIKGLTTENGTPPLAPYLLFLAIWAVVGVIGFRSTNMRTQLIAALVFFVVVSLWSSNMLFDMLV
jgi:hypothetical protein